MDAIRGMSIRRDILSILLLRWAGGDKSQIDATGLEHQCGTKVMLCFLRSEMIQQGAFETVVLFSKTPSACPTDQ